MAPKIISTPWVGLANLMADRGIDASTLARRTNLSPSTISMIINGHRKGTYHTRDQIARALGITRQQLDDTRTPSPHEWSLSA